MGHFSLSRFFVLVGALISLGIFLVACESESPEEKAQNYALAEARINEFIYREAAVLLSLKYEIGEKEVFELLTATFTFEPDFDTEGEKVRNRILKCSREYGIPKQVIASILIDSKTMCWNE